MIDRVRLIQATCGLCNRWWSWPHTEGERRHLEACPICRGDQARTCCSACGSMVGTRYRYDQGTRGGVQSYWCPVCHVNANREDLTIDDRDNIFYDYVMHLISEETIRATRQATPATPPDTTPRCHCNICGGRAARPPR